jgi:hypothetical protein
MKLKSKLNNRILHDFLWLDLLTLKLDKKVNFKLINFHVNSINSYQLSLNFNEILKDFKQFIRTIQILNLKKKSSLLIQISNNNEFNEFLKLYFDNNKSNKEILITNNFKKEKIKYKSSNRILLLIEESLEKHNSILLQKITKDSICIVNTWNCKLEKDTFASYKVYNNFKELKKIGFFLAMIKQV